VTAQAEALLAGMRAQTNQLKSFGDELTRIMGRCVVLDDELWNWAQYRAKQLGKESVSQYLFDLLREEKKAKS
jgi:hypothetical protein